MRRPYVAALGFVLAIFIVGTVCGFAWYRLIHVDTHDPLVENCIAVSDMQRQVFVCLRGTHCDREKTKQLQVAAIRVWVESYKSALDTGKVSRGVWDCAQNMDQRNDFDDLSSKVDELEGRVNDLEDGVSSS